MIVCKFEMWPRGDSAAARPIGEIRIANIGGDQNSGDYRIELRKSPEYAKRPGIWKAGVVRGFPRLRLGPYDLLLRGLAACIQQRNPGAALANGDALGDAPSEEL